MLPELFVVYYRFCFTLLFYGKTEPRMPSLSILASTGARASAGGTQNIKTNIETEHNNKKAKNLL